MIIFHGPGLGLWINSGLHIFGLGPGLRRPWPSCICQGFVGLGCLVK